MRNTGSIVACDVSEKKLPRIQSGAARLGKALLHALEVLRHCARCNSFTEDEVCPRCANPRRDAALLCVGIAGHIEAKYGASQIC